MVGRGRMKHYITIADFLIHTRKGLYTVGTNRLLSPDCCST